ncbi:hypothetical protein BGX28_009499 [Mortierella sp. GBA30]|nr:hypothetical protein BGX28_009499 [Mortierella sp. GBA30]
MTPKSATTLFSIPPEVLLGLAPHLSSHDLAQCMLVSRSWFGIFTPALWRDIGAYFLQLPGFNSQEALLALIRNSGHIRSFGTSCMNLAAILASLGTDCTRLHTLKLSTLHREFPVVSLPMLTKGTSNHSWNNAIYSNAEAVMALLRRNRCIRDLRLEGNFFCDAANRSALARILNYCPATVERLELDFRLPNAPGPRPSDDDGKAHSYPRATLPPPRLDALRELVLSGSISDHPAMLLFLERCPGLEFLRLNYVKGSFFTASSQILRDHCPRLDMLVCQSDGEEHDHELASLLRGSRAGWRSVSLPSMEDFGEHTFEALMENSETLEELEAAAWGQFVRLNAQQFLCTAKRLRKLAGCGDGLDYMFTRDITLKAIDMIEYGNWACSKTLDYLDLRIVGIPRSDTVCRHDGTPFLAPLEDLGETVTNREAHVCVYSQLGALTQLRELRLGELDEVDDLDVVTHLFIDPAGPHVRAFHYQCLEFSLDSGLDTLKNMKEMQVLDVRRMAHRIGIEELDWMYANWPKLRTIKGLLSDRLWEDMGPWAGRKNVEGWIAAHPLGIGSSYYADKQPRT